MRSFDILLCLILCVFSAHSHALAKSEPLYDKQSYSSEMASPPAFNAANEMERMGQQQDDPTLPQNLGHIHHTGIAADVNSDAHGSAEHIQHPQPSYSFNLEIDPVVSRLLYNISEYLMDLALSQSPAHMPVGQIETSFVFDNFRASGESNNIPSGVPHFSSTLDIVQTAVGEEVTEQQAGSLGATLQLKVPIEFANNVSAVSNRYFSKQDFQMSPLKPNESDSQHYQHSDLQQYTSGNSEGRHWLFLANLSQPGAVGNETNQLAAGPPESRPNQHKNHTQHECHEYKSDSVSVKCQLITLQEYYRLLNESKQQWDQDGQQSGDEIVPGVRVVTNQSADEKYAYVGAQIQALRARFEKDHAKLRNRTSKSFNELPSNPTQPTNTSVRSNSSFVHKRQQNQQEDLIPEHIGQLQTLPDQQRSGMETAHSLAGILPLIEKEIGSITERFMEKFGRS